MGVVGGRSGTIWSDVLGRMPFAESAIRGAKTLPKPLTVVRFKAQSVWMTDDTMDVGFRATEVAPGSKGDEKMAEIAFRRFDDAELVKLPKSVSGVDCILTAMNAGNEVRIEAKAAVDCWDSITSVRPDTKYTVVRNVIIYSFIDPFQFDVGLRSSRQ